MAFHIWLVYTAAAIGLSLAPGPNSLLALTHGAMHGRRKALFTLSGGSVGFAIIIALSMFGVAAILQASVGWLTLFKLAGGMYLVWLGIQVWRSPPIAIGNTHQADHVAGFSLFRRGFLAAVTNPKGILFFAAFLPQFVDPSRSTFDQFVIMAATFISIEFVVELTLAILAQRIARWLAKAGKTFNRTCGALFIAIGIVLPLRG